MTSHPTPPAAPRFALAWAALACILAGLTLGHPALAGQFLVSPVSDQMIAGYAFRDFAAQSLRAGDGVPLWNPYLFGGLPYVAAMHGDIFYPTAWLREVLPTDAAMTWGLILHLMLAGIGTYAFLRAVGLGFHGALAGGLAYMMSGPIAGLVSPGHDGKIFVSALLPFALLLLTRAIRDGRHWAWGMLAIVVGLGVLSPHPQLLQYLLLTAGAWALMLAFGGAGEERLARPQAVSRLGLALAAVIVGGAIGAIQYLPVSEYVDWSPRSGGKGWEHAVSYSMPIEEILNAYLPQFSGILDRYWGRNGIHFHSDYVGASVLVLAALGLGAVRGARRHLTWFWVGTGVITLLWALGGNTPFYHLVYWLVPGTKFFRAPSTIMYVTTFAVAVLAGLGTERLLLAEVNRRTLAIAGGFGVAVALLATVGFFEKMAFGLSQIPQTEGNITEGKGAVILGAWRSMLFLGAVVGIAYGVAARRITAPLAGALLALTIVADLWSVERLYFRFSPPAAVTFASDPAIEHIKQEKEPVRVIAIDLTGTGVPRDPNLAGDGLMAHGIRLAFGYHGNELRYYQELDGEARGRDQMGNPAFWALANVKYFYTTADSLPVPGARKVVGPVRNAAGSQISLFELPEAHPYAWVVPAMAKYPDQAVADAVRAPNFPVRNVAILAEDSKVAAPKLEAIPAPLAITAKVEAYGPGRATIALEAPAPAGSALVVSENYYPGWSASVDGQPVAPERANLSLMAVPLPAGARKVELSFDSPAYHTGRTVTLAALGLAVLALMAGFFVGRRHRPELANG
ncbi:MAG: YfhO family protein [Gemmatimonadaceae bacterium]|nr:YfhO family protein [Gemmatimonadaceae bacterium]